jgi:hypothetical protein
MSKKPEIPEAVLQFFRKQGKIGGKKRAENLSSKERTEQARKAVNARWKKYRDNLNNNPEK